MQNFFSGQHPETGMVQVALNSMKLKYVTEVSKLAQDHHLVIS
jgi:hypothetical protein